MTGNEMYEMKLNECKPVDDETGLAEVRRVPGGWIYTMFYSGTSHSVFVPTSHEFLNLETLRSNNEF